MPPGGGMSVRGRLRFLENAGLLCKHRKHQCFNDVDALFFKQSLEVGIFVCVKFRLTFKVINQIIDVLLESRLRDL